jgi:hypothetical protein
MDYELVPVRTRILTHRDNIVDAIESYVKDTITDKDVICVAESVVAITQNRMLRPQTLKPGFLARTLCYFIPQKGSLSSCYGMQAAMDMEGEWRFVWAMLIGMVAKLFGKSGVFYTLAGPTAALIDDVTGTMPPYDKYIVLGPSNAEAVAEEIRQRLGCFGAVVADVNDLKRSLIVGATEKVDKAKVAYMLIHNPFGNASQKTPIVIVKNYATAVDKVQLPVG